jgi:hypothetical protein
MGRNNKPSRRAMASAEVSPFVSPASRDARIAPLSRAARAASG